MSRYKRVEFHHLSDDEKYRKYFPTESGIGEIIDIIYGKMGERASHASMLFHGTQKGYPYTIKVYKNKLPLSSSVINKRITLLKSLEPHPRVCRVLDFLNYEGNHGSFSYVKMDFVQGKGLDVALREDYNGHCPQNLVLNWALQLLDGLKFLHSKYVSVHLTLSNIVLGDRDKSVCISDISHLVSQKEEPPVHATNIPDDQFGAGMSGIDESDQPVIFKKKQVRRDIFHLGGVLFELFTGQRMDDKLKFLSNEEKKKRLTDNGATPDVADVIVKAIHADRSKRYGSAQEMIDALQHLPLNNPQYRKHTGRKVRDVLTVILCLGISLMLFSIGNYQIRRANEMEMLTQKAETEWTSGRYTQAWNTLLNALEERIDIIDPPPFPDAMMKAAEYLGIYQFRKGYKPFYSTDMDGQIVTAAISPFEDAFAVMTRNIDPSSLRPVRHIHILNPENGQELNVTQSNAEAAPDLFFLNDSLLIYTDERGQLALYNWKRSQEETLNFPARVVRIALSEDKRTAACLCEDGAVYTVQIDVEKGTLKQDYTTVCLPQTVLNASAAPENRLFALNEDGTKLVISFVGGKAHSTSVRMYTKNKSEPYEYIFRTDEIFDHFEGGFWEDRIAFVAWSVVEGTTALDSVGQSYYSAFYALQWNGANKPNKFYRYYGTEVHASVGKHGIYFSHKTDVEQLSVSAEGGWYLRSPLSVEAGVRYLQHIRERTLLVSRNNTVEVLLDNDSVSLPTSNGISFSNGTISDRYVLLFDLNSGVGVSQSRNTLSVMKWSDADVFLHYTKAQYHHQRFQILSDASAAVLYGADRESNEIFNIWCAGANATSDSDEPVRIFAENADEIRSLTCLSPIVETDPPDDCLKAVYSPNHAEYYSMKTGELIKPESRYLSEDAEAGSVYTRDYLLKKRAADAAGMDTLEIIDRVSGKIVKQHSVTGLLAGAAQCNNPDILFISMLSMENTPYALLLDNRHEIIAEIQGAVTMLEDGTLYQDDGNGYITKGSVYSKEALVEALTKAVTDSEALDK